MPHGTRNRPALRRALDHVRAEPVAFQGIVQATLAALVGFGLLTWSAQQTGLVLALAAAVLSFVTRRSVTPHPKSARR
jgi:type IV secretory pathway TrbD component